MNKEDNKMIAGKIMPAIISVVILVLIDQITKYYISNTMDLYDSIPIIDGIFEIHYIRNAGAAWGMFQNKQILFYIETIIVLFIALIIYLRCLSLDKYKDIRVLILFISSGAIGNFIDRIRFKYVIDFIYFKIINFPVFNIADCYVTVGVLVLICIMMFKYKESDYDEIFKK